MSSRNPGPILTTISKGEMDAIPQPYRGACKFTFTTQPVPLETALTATTGTIVESKLGQTRTDEKNNAITTVEFPTVPQAGFVITAQGQLASVSYIIGPTESLSIAAGPLVIDGSIVPITDKISVATTTTVGVLFDQSAQTNTQAFTIPDEYLAPGAYRETIASVSAGTVATPDALGTGGKGITKASAQRITSEHVLKTVETLFGTTDEPLTNYERGPQGQAVTATKTISTDGTAFAIDSTTLSATVTNVGGGSFERLIKNATLFSEQLYSISIALPRELMHRLPTTETASIVAGNATQPTLTTGDIEKQEQQVTLQTKRVTARTFNYTALAATPIVYTGTEWTTEYGGVFLEVITTLSTTIRTKSEADLEFVAFSSEQIAPGLFLTIEKSNPDETWPTLTEKELDPLLQSLITITSKVVAASTSLAATVVGTLQRLVPIDQYKSLLVITTYELPADYSEVRTIGFRYPGRTLQTLNVTGCGYAFEVIPPRELLVEGTVQIHFSASLPTVLSPDNFLYSSMSINGSVPVEGLTDGYTTDLCPGTSITIPGSSPTVTAYNTYVADPVTYSILASARAELWKAGIYRREYILIPYK